jgi:hypothetical protein
MSTIAGVDGLEITGPIEDRFDEILTPRAGGGGGPAPPPDRGVRLPR